MKSLKHVLFYAPLFSCAAGLLLYPEVSTEAAREGLTLCFEVVLPSLFPFFVLSNLLIAGGALQALERWMAPCMLQLFGVGGAGAAALLLGLAGGYPVGAKTAAALYAKGEVSRCEAEQLLAFCSNSGPGFFLGVCAVLFQSPRVGTYLYLIHTFSALLTGILLRQKQPQEHPHSPPTAKSSFSPLRAFPSAVQNGFGAVWNVCGFVILFMVLLRLFSLLPMISVLSPLKRAALFGFLEMTNGVAALPRTHEGFVLCAALTAWGGLSVHAQTLALLEGTPLRTHRYFLGKALQAIISVPLASFAAARLF